jgi:starvation-inducible DNA-binding protein
MENGTLEKTKQQEKKEANKKRVYALLGYTKMETAEIVDAMNKLIANYSVHYQKLRNFHWNVKGSDFFDIHEQFEQQYDEAIVNIDDIAERIRVFGQTPLSTMKDYLDNSDIEESPSDLAAMDMVKEILSDYRILIEHLYNVLDFAIDNGDSGTEDLIKGMIVSIEKHHWMMTSFHEE